MLVEFSFLQFANAEEYMFLLVPIPLRLRDTSQPSLSDPAPHMQHKGCVSPVHYLAPSPKFSQSSETRKERFYISHKTCGQGTIMTSD